MDFAKIRPRGGTKAQWEKANPVLAKREIGVQWETTIGVGEVVIKIGDGVTDWINLPEAVKSDITKKIIAALAVVPDDDPDLADGDSLDTLFGKIAKKFKYLKDNKLDKSARYDGTDSTSTELVPTANALRGVNAKADKNASDITTLNNNLSNSLQYVHTAENPFDFNDANTPAGFHRINDSDSFKNPPTDITNAVTLNYGNVFVCKSNNQSDTLSMTFYPCFDNTVFMKTANTASWKDKGWIQFVSKSDLLTQLLGNVKVTGEDARSSVELFSSLPGNTLYFFHCPGTKGIAAELGFSDVNNALCGFIYKASTWRGCGILIPMTGVVTDYNIFVGRLEAENKLKWVGIK